jgi:uncharacterized cupin superfamily protein
MSHLIAYRDREVEPAVNMPFFAELLSGTPTTTAWRYAVSSDGLVSSGIWSATPGIWRMDYKLWEYCHILEGGCILTAENEAPKIFGAGDTFVCEPGLRGTWEVPKSLKKQFVIRRT